MKKYITFRRKSDAVKMSEKLRKVLNKDPSFQERIYQVAIDSIAK